MGSVFIVPRAKCATNGKNEPRNPWFRAVFKATSRKNKKIIEIVIAYGKTAIIVNMTKLIVANYHSCVKL